MTQHLIEPHPCTLSHDWMPAAPSRRARVAPPRPRAPSPLLALGWALATSLTLGAATAVTPARAQTSVAEVAADLRMAQDAAPMRAAADAFVARAMAGERDAVLAMLSPALVTRIGHDTAVRVLDAQILPFFQRGRQVGRSTTVTRTTDATGSSGFAFYQWLEPQDGGAARPFTLYVVREQGRVVVANIVPDRLVEGRHR
jgi:hypothetical protein